jgi:23S rRNA pseudouridine1911/1915/1917 synthase
MLKSDPYSFVNEREEKDIVLAVDSSLAGLRMDHLVMTDSLDLSRSRLQVLIRSGNVTVNGKTVKPSHVLKEGEVVTCRIPAPESLDTVAQNIPLQIVYEDSDVIAINKPRGMVVHPGAGIQNNTVVNALLHHCKDLSGIGGVTRPGIVHRLDKGTSGVLIAAKNDAAHLSLSKQFAARTMKKEYLAVTLKTPNWTEHVFDAPIGRHPAHRVKMAVVPSGKPARTAFGRIARSDKGCLLSAHPHSGRTHQIRVHLHALGLPILGDTLYAQHKHLPGHLKHALKSVDGFCLHARSLVFRHPVSNKLIRVAGDIPEDFLKILELLDILM